MLIKQEYGPYFAIGGNQTEIYPLWLSLFNWGGTNGEIMWMADDFGYFLIERGKYFKGRISAFCNNHEKFWLNTHNGKLIYKLALFKTQKEWDNIRGELFLNHNFYDQEFEHSLEWDDTGFFIQGKNLESQKIQCAA